MDSDETQRTLVWAGSASSDSAAVPSLLGPFDLSRFYHDHAHADLRLVCADGAVFRGHRAVLGATCSHVRRFLLRTPANEEEAEVTLALPDFTLSEVDDLMRVVYGVPGDGNESSSVSKELIAALGCSYEVAQHVSHDLTLHYGKEPRRLSSKAWDFQQDAGGEFRCPVEGCEQGHGTRTALIHHLCAEHRKSACLLCSRWVDRRAMEDHFAAEHAETYSAKDEPGGGGNTDVIETHTGDDENVWTKDVDEEYVPAPQCPTKRRKRKRKGSPSNARSVKQKRREFKEDPDNPGSLLCPVDGCDFTDESRKTMNSHVMQVRYATNVRS